MRKLILDLKLFETVVGTELSLPVDKVKTNEALVLNVGTTVTSGVVTSAREDIIEVNLRKPVCAEAKSKVAISRRIADSWRLIGFRNFEDVNLPVKVILDSNFLMIPFQFHIDIFQEIEYLLQKKVDFIVPSSVKLELTGISVKRRRGSVGGISRAPTCLTMSCCRSRPSTRRDS